MSGLILPGRFSGQRKNKDLEIPDPTEDGYVSSDAPFQDKEIEEVLAEHEMNLANMILSFCAERGLKSVIMHYRFFGEEVEGTNQWTGGFNRQGEFSHEELDRKVFPRKVPDDNGQ